MMAGWYYTASMTNNLDASRMAMDFKRDMSVVIEQAVSLHQELSLKEKPNDRD